MCTFEDRDRVAVVCDVALGHVREAVRRELGGSAGAGAEFIHREGQGTLVRLAPGLDPVVFRAAVEEGMQGAAAGSS
ncbi:MAG: hypothetical protein ACRDKW_08510 [Actinomycetota bacterium]